MIGYIVRRLLYTIPLILGVALIIFIIFHVVTPNPVYLFLGKSATPHEVALMERQLGLDEPLVIQFVDFLRQIVTFDYGYSFQTHEPISEIIKRGIVPSLFLTVPAFLGGTLLGILLGIICAFFHNSITDKGIVVLSVMGMSISSLALILIGQYFLAFHWEIFPISGYEPGFAAIQYLLLPWLIWISISVGSDVRFYRTVMMNEIRQDYVRTAYAKGLPTKIVLFRHVLANALIPIITRVVIALPFLYTGSLLLENFFAIPGLGNMQVNAILHNDWPVIKAITMVGALLYIGANLASDILYAFVDPRVQLK